MKIQHISALVFLAAVSLFACKKDDDSPSPKQPSENLSITISESFEDQYLEHNDTIDIVFEAVGKDYSIEYLGEKRVYYPSYDSTMYTCSFPDYNAFYLVGNPTTIQVTEGQKVTQKVVFGPSNFSFELSEFSLNCSSGECYPMQNCITQNSNGIGKYKSLLQFKVNGRIETIEVTATAMQSGKGMVVIK